MCNLIKSSASGKATVQIEAISPDRHRVTVRCGRVVETYRVTELDTGWEGRAFRFRKMNGIAYETYIGRNPADHLCDCMGHEQHGHCKHVVTLEMLCDANLLPGSTILTPEYA